MGLSDFFIDVSTLPDDGYGLVQLISLGGVYGYILFNASNMMMPHVAVYRRSMFGRCAV